MPCSVPGSILRTKVLIYPHHLTVLYHESNSFESKELNFTLMYFLKYYFQKMSMRTLSFSSVNEMLLSHLA